MSIGIYLGATTGSTDGTLEVPGNATGVTLGAVGTTATFHLRESATGFANSQAVTVTAPADCQVSKDDSTYAASVEYAIGAIANTNVVCYIKRTAGTAAATTGLVTTPRLAVVTTSDVAAPSLSGTLTATAGDTQVTLVGPTATDNVGIAKWQYRIGSGSWVDIASSASGTMPSTVVTGLTNGTAYSFTVRAVDAATNASSASNAATATPAASDVFSQSYATDSLDTSKIGTSVGGSGAVSVTGGELRLYGTVVADANIMYLKNAVNSSVNRRYTLRFKQVASSDGGAFTVLGVVQGASEPVVETNASGNPFDASRRIGASLYPPADANFPGDLTVSYFTTAHTRMYYHSGGTYAGTYQTSPASGASSVIALDPSAYYRLVFESEYNAGTPRWRILIKSEDGSSTLATLPWVNWSDVENVSSNPYRVWGGEQYAVNQAGYCYIDGRYSLISCEAY